MELEKLFEIILSRKPFKIGFKIFVKMISNDVLSMGIVLQ